VQELYTRSKGESSPCSKQIKNLIFKDTPAGPKTHPVDPLRFIKEKLAARDAIGSLIFHAVKSQENWHGPKSEAGAFWLRQETSPVKRETKNLIKLSQNGKAIKSGTCGVTAFISGRRGCEFSGRGRKRHSRHNSQAAQRPLSLSLTSSSCSSPGKTGESLSTVVSMLTVETVTSSRKAVSTREHLLTGWQRRMLIPRGSRMAALAQSTIAWWNSSPCDHLCAHTHYAWIISL
jgi:hypothetical protein